MCEMLRLPAKQPGAEGGGRGVGKHGVCGMGAGLAAPPKENHAPRVRITLMQLH